MTFPPSPGLAAKAEEKVTDSPRSPFIGSSRRLSPAGNRRRRSPEYGYRA